jgi:hypothetical protein
VKHGGKHYTAKSTFISSGSVPTADLWQQSYVQQESSYNAEDPTTLEAPVLIFDTDTDAATDVTTTCGITWSTIYSNAGSVRNQLRNATDYRGAFALLLALGFTSTAAHAALEPRTEASRELDPANATQFPTAPSGGAASERANWALEFRQPSFIQLLGQNLNGVGFWNYSRALPRARRQLSSLNEFNANFAPEQGGRVEVKGINKDGFEVTNQGLISTDTGEVVAVEGIGAEDDRLPTQFNDISVENLSISGTLDVGGVVALEGGESIAMQTNRYGMGQLATINDLLTVTQASANDEQINHSSDKLLTLTAANRLFIQRRFISASTDTVIIFVKGSATDRNLDSMFDRPPTAVADAIPTLARAAEYANAIIGAGNQTAEIRIAPGLYDPASIWQCNVLLRSYNADLTAPIWASNSVGTSSVANNYFDGSGYADYVNSVNFWSASLLLRDTLQAGGQLHIFWQPRTIRFNRRAMTEGGFHFLGLNETIKAVGESRIPIASFLFLSQGETLPALADFTSNLTSNVDTLLSKIRVLNRSGATTYDAITNGPLIRLTSGAADNVNIFDCVFGPSLPSHKDSLGAGRDPFITVDTSARIVFRNNYIRGKTTITSTGIGVTAGVPLANVAHYGTAAVNAPWTWEQTHHTFIGATPRTTQSLNLVFGSDGIRVDTSPSLPNARSYYADLTGKLLPNHIHLLDNSGAVPIDNNVGPFFDQFIHAQTRLFVGFAWRRDNETQAQTIGNRFQGFVGRIGRNGYNSTKTRGVLGGNDGVLDIETGFTFLMGEFTRSTGSARTIFQRAGLTSAEADAAGLPTFNASSTSTGEGFPTGLNPVMTTDTSGSAALNVALRSYLRGISTTNAITIPSTNLVL